MSGINKYDDKEKRRQRMRNHIAKDLRTPKFAQKIEKDRRKKFINSEEEGFFFEDRYYDDETDD